jgi:hypothetical protein
MGVRLMNLASGDSVVALARNAEAESVAEAVDESVAEAGDESVAEAFDESADDNSGVPDNESGD